MEIFQLLIDLISWLFVAAFVHPTYVQITVMECFGPNILFFFYLFDFIFLFLFLLGR